MIVWVYARVYVLGVREKWVYVAAFSPSALANDKRNRKHGWNSTTRWYVACHMESRKQDCAQVNRGAGEAARDVR